VLKRRYPRVPVLALTATATRRVEADIAAQLALPACTVFRSSFNRANLVYEVRPKPLKAAAIQEVADLITARYVQGGRLQCGIVYVLSRKDSETVAADLNKALRDLRRQGNYPLVAHYHAAMEAEDRQRVQADWTLGRTPVIVATIAFGMGINKADVRFVVHFSMSKSLEGYHQETGRAGRDGSRAQCVLLYAYGDAVRLRDMIRSSAAENGTSSAALTANLDALNAMIAFCEEAVDCRRAHLLSYFGEAFDAGQCRAGCDLCVRGARAGAQRRDCTAAAGAVLRIAAALGGKAFLTYVVDVLRGSASARRRGDDRLPDFGAGRALTTADATRLVRAMVVRHRLLDEETARNEHHGGIVAVLRPARGALETVAAGRVRVELAFPGGGGGRKDGPLAVSSPFASGPLGGGVGRPTVPRLALAPAKAGAGATATTQADDPIVDEPSQAPGRGGGALAVSEETHRAIVREAFAQLNRGLDTGNAGKVTFAPRVVEALAARRPATRDALRDEDVPGLSHNQRKVHGTAILIALGQVASFVAAGAAGGPDGFVLDMEAVWATKRTKRPASGGGGGAGGGGGGGGQSVGASGVLPGWVDEGDDGGGFATGPPPPKTARMTQADVVAETAAAAAAMMAADDWDDGW
jgi:superfamily II DNA helicase RecQ